MRYSALLLSNNLGLIPLLRNEVDPADQETLATKKQGTLLLTVPKGEGADLSVKGQTRAFPEGNAGKNIWQEYWAEG